MSEIGELSFCELRRKDIVNVTDGKKLGKIVDLVFSAGGRVQGIVAPYGKRFLFFRSQEVYIPYCNIKTIGEDIILVDISTGLNQHGARSVNPSKMAHPERIERPNECPPDKSSECDGRCDKCMLFDCESRWKKQPNVYVDNAPYN